MALNQAGGIPRLAAAPRHGVGRAGMGALDWDTRTMHILCMATKTISVRLEAYEKLRRARRFSGESFSEVILRARWDGETLTGAELLARCRERGAHFSEAELAEIEQAKADQEAPEDKWATR